MWDRFAAAGVDLAAISVDPTENNRAMVDKLLLPFALLSDPGGDVIRDWGLWTDDDGGLARPAIFAVRPDSALAWRYIGRDFADRPTDDELFGSFAGGS